MSGSFDRPPTKTTTPSTTEHISPAHPASPPSRSKALTPVAVAGVAGTAGQLVSPRLGQRNLRWLRGVTRRWRRAAAVRRSRVVRRQPAPRSGLLTGLDSPIQAGLNDLTATAGNSCPFGDGGRQWWWTFGTLRLSSGRGGVWRGTSNRALTSARTDRGIDWTSGACGNVIAPTE